jgi:porin
MNSRNKLHLIAATIIGALAVGAGGVRAGDAPASPSADVTAKDNTGATSDSAASALPTPNYSGDFLTRSTLTGDWGGLRNDLAKKGITFDVSLTQTYMGPVSGGVHQNWDFGGRGDFILNLDTGKMGLWPGGFLSVEVEGNYGQGGNPNSGSLMPVNTNQLFPVPGDNRVALPALTYTQFLSEYFGVLVGKLPTMAADNNAFAHGKGDTQFMNLALNVIPIALFAAPYTPLAVAAIILPTKNPDEAVVELAAFTSTGKGDSAGWDTIDGDNTTFWGEGRVRTGFFGMTGHQLLGGLYSTKEFKSIDQRLSLDPTTQLVAKKSGSWAVYYNFDQYLYEPVKGSGKGFGIFGRLGIADGNPNFLQHFYSLGVGGKGLVPGRPNDAFGVGWYYIGINNLELSTPVGVNSFLRDEQGFEAYYNIAVTPWAHLTPDIQVVHGALRHTIHDLTEIDTAVVMGVRLRLVF